MTVEYNINVKSYNEIAERMSKVNLSQSSKSDALMDAIKMTLREPILTRTPMSTLQNPIYQDKDGKVRPGYKGKIGKMNLRNDFDISNIQMSSGIMRIRVGFPNVEYASYVHALPKSSNWSTPGTGPLYVKEPIEQNENLMITEFLNNIDFILKSEGVL